MLTTVIVVTLILAGGVTGSVRARHLVCREHGCLGVERGGGLYPLIVSPHWQGKDDPSSHCGGLG